MVDGMTIALERLRTLSRASFLTKAERDAIKYAIVVVEDIEQMFEKEGLTLHGD